MNIPPKLRDFVQKRTIKALKSVEGSPLAMKLIINNKNLSREYYNYLPYIKKKAGIKKRKNKIEYKYQDLNSGGRAALKGLTDTI